MTDDERRDTDLHERLRASFARAAVPAAPPSLHARVHELGTRQETVVARRPTRLMLLAAAAIVATALLASVQFVGSRRPPSPSPSLAPSSAPAAPYVPPGTMALFADGQ